LVIIPAARNAASHRGWLDGGDDGSIEARSLDFQRLRRELLAAERAAVNELRRAGDISDEVARRVERDLDLEDARLEI
jgi:CPA1 family monovalent cation:H+ antiporter